MSKSPASPFLAFCLSSATALWMTASTFDLLPARCGHRQFRPRQVVRLELLSMQYQLLRQTQVSDLRELSFPTRDDATDVFTLKTDRGTGYLDQGTGALLTWADLTTMERVSETIYMLHTGQGAAVLGSCWG